MDPATKRSGSITFLLVGLVLLVTVAGLVVPFVPFVDCPLERHIGEASARPAWRCPLCGGWGSIQKTTLWRKWTWRPKTAKDWLEVEPEKRPKDLKGWSIYDYNFDFEGPEKKTPEERPKFPEEKK